MITLFCLFVAEALVFAWLWHNESMRSGTEREVERPDRAALYSGRSPDSRAPAPSVEEGSKQEESKK